MQDKPDAIAILGEVEEALKAGLGSGLPQRMAANALALARRELSLPPDEAEREHARLAALLGREGSVEALNAALAEAIRSGAMTADTPGLVAHLWQSTIEKMRVDQPAYPAFAAWLREGQGQGGRE